MKKELKFKESKEHITPKLAWTQFIKLRNYVIGNFLLLHTYFLVIVNLISRTAAVFRILVKHITIYSTQNHHQSLLLNIQPGPTHPLVPLF